MIRLSCKKSGDHVREEFYWEEFVPKERDFVSKSSNLFFVRTKEGRKEKE